MRIALSAVCLIIIFVSSPAFSSEQGYNSIGLPNGHHWSELSGQSKEDMIFALLMGYEWGYADGVVSGRSTDSGKVESPRLPMLFIKPDDYVKKVDTFYAKYPSCKDMDLLNVFGNLLSIWHKETIKLATQKEVKKVTYSEIGQLCMKDPIK